MLRCRHRARVMCERLGARVMRAWARDVRAHDNDS
jgi:hypothetical protein